MNYGTSMFLFVVLPLISVAIFPSVLACPARPQLSWRPRFFSSSFFPPDLRRSKSRKHVNVPSIVTLVCNRDCLIK
jgi:hypothetical protein